MIRPASSARLASPELTTSALEYRRRCIEVATWRNSPARNVEATNSAAKFLTLRSTCWFTTDRGAVTTKWTVRELSAGVRSILYSKLRGSELHDAPIFLASEET